MAGIHPLGWPAPANVQAFFTTRDGGMSKAPYDSLNLGLHVGDDTAAVLHNRSLLPHSKRIQWLQQVHGTHCLDLDGPSADPLTADATTTTQSSVVCAVMTADCLPVLLCDKQGSRVAAVHAGWRGLAAGMLQSSLVYFPQAENVMAWLGPAISPLHFEVGQDVVDALPSSLHSALLPGKAAAGKFHLDLYQAARLILNRAGVTSVYGGEACTYAEPDRFFSHRRSTHLAEPATGRMVSAIYLI